MPNKPIESKADLSNVTITYFQPKKNIITNRETMYKGAKKANDISNYGAQAEFEIKDFVW